MKEKKKRIDRTMKCEKCGANVEKGSKFCDNCGASLVLLKAEEPKEGKKIKEPKNKLETPEDLKKIRKRKLMVGVIFLSVILIVSLVFILVGVNKNKYRNVYVNDSNGEVSLTRGNGSTFDVEASMRLIPEDEVKVLESSYLDLLADEDKHIAVLENSKITLESKGNPKKGFISINLMYGQTIVDIENKLKDDDEFRVISPNATVSVRGTTFSVSYDKDLGITRIDVKSGKVKVESNSGDSITLSDGESAEVIDETITTRTLNDAEVDAIFFKDEDGIYIGRSSQYLSAKEGDIVSFGTWEGEPIEWYVLENNGREVVLLSKDYLFKKEYHSELEPVTWETSSLREYLNGEFYDIAFNSEEKNVINVANLKNEDNLYFAYGGIGREHQPDLASDGEYYCAGGNETKDKVYLLSLSEIRDYYGVGPEEYDKYRMEEWDLDTYSEFCDTASNGILLAPGTDGWWLRSPGHASYTAALVLHTGAVYVNEHFDVDCDFMGVRPVIRVSTGGHAGEEKSVGVEPETIDESRSDTETVEEIIPADIDAILSGNVNDIVTFGTYKDEPLEWYILETNGSEVVLLSKNSVRKSTHYNMDETGHGLSVPVTWETCSIRKWLNEDFYTDAFTESEQLVIKTSILENNDNPYYGTRGNGEEGEKYPSGGNNTEDKVYLLSLEDIEKYWGITVDDFATYWESKKKDYLTYGATCNEASGGILDIGVQWMLRSPGTTSGGPAHVSEWGGVDYRFVKTAGGLDGDVRPVIKVGL